jgi:hypothetical protein
MMRILKELTAELVEMFFAERRLTLAVLALVATTGLLVDFAGLERLAGGAILLFGSLIVLVASVCHAARAGAPQDTPA